MAITYEKIATATTSAGNTSITLSSIPSTYTDLVLIINGTNSQPSDLRMRFNSNTSSIYSTTIIYGFTSSGSSSRESNQTSFYGAFQTDRSTIITNINNYANTNTYKTALTRFNSVGNFLSVFGQLWRSTSAIDSITCYVTSGSYNAGVTFSLYGILKA